MSDQNETIVSNSFNIVSYPAEVPITELSRVKKARVTQSIIEQLGELDRQAQISVMRAVAAFHEIEQELG